MSKQRLQGRIAVVAAALADDVRDAARRARVAGFAGIEIEAYSPRLNLPDLSTSGRRELRGILSREQQRLVAVRCDLDPRGFGPGADVDRVLAQLERALESAAGLDAVCACIDVGPLPAAPVAVKPRQVITPEQAGLIILPAAATQPPAPVPPAPPSPDPTLVAQVQSALEELCERADRYRITVALSSSLSSLASLYQAISRLSCPWFGVDFDPVALLRDAGDLDEAFSAVGHLVRRVRGRDAAAGADARTRPAVIGQGSVDWPRLLDALDEAGYGGPITIDPTQLPDRSRAALAGKLHLESLY